MRREIGQYEIASVFVGNTFFLRRRVEVLFAYKVYYH